MSHHALHLVACNDDSIYFGAALLDLTGYSIRMCAAPQRYCMQFACDASSIAAVCMAKVGRGTTGSSTSCAAVSCVAIISAAVCVTKGQSQNYKDCGCACRAWSLAMQDWYGALWTCMYTGHGVVPSHYELGL